MRAVTESKSDALKGKMFPCPVCKENLRILLSVKEKPYCICNDCGIQIFFRGKTGIDRLKHDLQQAKSESGKSSNASQVTAFFGHLENLRAEKSALEQKQGIFFRDQFWEDAIAAIDAEIRNMELELKKIRRTAEKRK